jgi:hypothetical protein
MDTLRPRLIPPASPTIHHDEQDENYAKGREQQAEVHRGMAMSDETGPISFKLSRLQSIAEAGAPVWARGSGPGMAQRPSGAHRMRTATAMPSWNSSRVSLQCFRPPATAPRFSASWRAVSPADL